MAAPTPIAAVSDLAEWLGEAISEDADVTRAGWALRMASALVRAEAGLTWLNDEGALDNPPETAVLVTLACAARGYKNPTGVSDVTEQIDDYMHREHSSVEESGFYLTDSERFQLGKLGENYRGGIGTVTTERGDLEPIFCYDDEEERLLPPWY